MPAKRVMIVEDAKNVREILAFMFKNRGYDVFQASDGDTAFKEIKEIQPDVVLLDVMLPGKDGFEICAELKNDPKYKHIKIVLLTAIAQGTGKPDEYWQQKTQADDFISKPFSARDVLTRVERLLNTASSNKK